jgi:hypothetical protein
MQICRLIAHGGDHPPCARGIVEVFARRPRLPHPVPHRGRPRGSFGMVSLNRFSLNGARRRLFAARAGKPRKGWCRKCCSIVQTEPNNETIENELLDIRPVHALPKTALDGARRG